MCQQIKSLIIHSDRGDQNRTVTELFMFVQVSVRKHLQKKKPTLCEVGLHLNYKLLDMKLFFDVLRHYFTIKQVDDAVCVVGIVR